MSHNPRVISNHILDDQLEVYGDNTYQYNDDGYLQTKTTPDGTTTYSYGAMGELLEVVTPTQTISYLHNASNQRVAKLVDGTITEKYLWANLTTLLAIYDKDSNLLQRFNYADQRMPIAMVSSGSKYYLHYDQVGTLRAVTNSSHTIVKEIAYDTYGNILTDSNPTLKVLFGFAGGLYDSDTKLTRFGYRDYIKIKFIIVLHQISGLNIFMHLIVLVENVVGCILIGHGMIHQTLIIQVMNVKKKNLKVKNVIGMYIRNV